MKWNKHVFALSVKYVNAGVKMWLWMCILIAFVVVMERGFTRHAITTAVRLGMNQKYMLFGVSSGHHGAFVVTVILAGYAHGAAYSSPTWPCWDRVYLLKTKRYTLFQYQTTLQVPDVSFSGSRILKKQKKIQLKKKWLLFGAQARCQRVSASI